MKSRGTHIGFTRQWEAKGRKSIWKRVEIAKQMQSGRRTWILAPELGLQEWSRRPDDPRAQSQNKWQNESIGLKLLLYLAWIDIP
jgi:hypothetical protein